MRFLFSLVIIIQLLAFNIGNALDLFDTGMWVEDGRNKVRPQMNVRGEPNIDEQVVAPVNEENFSLTKIISSGCKKIKPALPIIAYFIFRFLQECPGDCPIE